MAAGWRPPARIRPSGSGTSRPGQEVLTLHGHTDIVPTVAFSPDGNRLATAGADGVVLIREAGPAYGSGPAHRGAGMRRCTESLSCSRGHYIRWGSAETMRGSRTSGVATSMGRLPSAAGVGKIAAAQNVSPTAATKRVATGAALVDALFEAASEDAIGVLPALVIPRALEVGRGTAGTRSASRPWTHEEHQETGSHGMAVVVTYRPECRPTARHASVARLCESNPRERLAHEETPTFCCVSQPLGRRSPSRRRAEYEQPTRHAADHVGRHHVRADARERRER